MFYSDGFKVGVLGSLDGALVVILTLVIGTIVTLF
jgi:hypothetical protein